MRRKHNDQKEFEEKVSELLLKELLPERYGGLIKHESPDLIDPNTKIGVEITNAATPDFRKEYSESRKDRDKNYRECGQFMPFGGAFWGNMIDLESAFCKKKKLLETNSSFSDYKIDLFINATFADESDIDSFEEFLLSDENGDLSSSFNWVMVRYEKTLAILDCSKKIWKKISISQKLFQDSRVKAKEELGLVD